MSAREPRLSAVLDQMKPGNLIRAKDIAAALKVSERSVYRYITALRTDGHRIVGDPGVGYMLRTRP